MGFAIVDVESHALSAEDKEILQHPAVASVILFSRNYESPAQLKALTDSIHQLRPDLCVFADQEGGRVQRFREGFTILPSFGEWGRRFNENAERAHAELTKTITVMTKELKDVGIDASFTPVLDIDEGISDVIGERSFGKTAEKVVALANIVIDTMRKAGMPVTGKHFPGHGGVAADSHKSLPIDQRNRDKILNKDLRPFIELNKRLDAMMPAHVVYEAFDDKPAGFSSFWLKEMLRDEIGFDGVVISDDLTMEGAAAFGSYEDRARLALEAGCDLLLICNNRQGAVEVLDNLGDYNDPVSSQRIRSFIGKMR